MQASGLAHWPTAPIARAWRTIEVVRGMRSDPTITNLTIRDYAVMEGPSRVTRGLANG